MREPSQLGAEETASETPSFFDLARAKRGFRAEYIEIAPDWRERLPSEVGASGRFLQGVLRPAGSVLDVGAGDRFYEHVLAALGLTGSYASADLDDRVATHDYADFFRITQRYDAILLFELIEHVSFDLGMRFLRHAFHLLTPGGVLVCSTPNAHHPNQVWRATVTHVRPWPADDLYGALKLVGFRRVRMVRQYTLARRRRVVAPVTKLMYRMMELDHAQTTLAAAWRPIDS